MTFHYADWPTAGAGVRLEPHSVLDDPVPFIRATVEPAVESLTDTRR